MLLLHTHIVKLSFVQILLNFKERKYIPEKIVQRRIKGTDVLVNLPLMNTFHSSHSTVLCSCIFRLYKLLAIAFFSNKNIKMSSFKIEMLAVNILIL